MGLHCSGERGLGAGPALRARATAALLRLTWSCAHSCCPQSRLAQARRVQFEPSGSEYGEVACSSALLVVPQLNPPIPLRGWQDSFLRICQESPLLTRTTPLPKLSFCTPVWPFHYQKSSFARFASRMRPTTRSVCAAEAVRSIAETATPTTPDLASGRNQLPHVTSQPEKVAIYSTRRTVASLQTLDCN